MQLSKTIIIFLTNVMSHILVSTDNEHKLETHKKKYPETCIIVCRGNENKGKILEPNSDINLILQKNESD
jgi:hypothetical protein